MKKELLVIGNVGIYLLIDGFNVKKKRYQGNRLLPQDELPKTDESFPKICRYY